jgi:hypothetical protein
LGVRAGSTVLIGDVTDSFVINVSPRISVFILMGFLYGTHESITDPVSVVRFQRFACGDLGGSPAETQVTCVSAGGGNRDIDPGSRA